MNARTASQTRRPTNVGLDRPGNELGWQIIKPKVTQPKRIRINGIDLTYAERGKGEPVILVHGALGDYRTWSPQLDALSHRYHVISYSRRYHQAGVLNSEARDYTHRRNVDDLIAIIDAIQLGPVHLVGHSYGGAVAALVAMERPELVGSLVLGEPTLFSMLSHPNDMVSLRLHRIALNVVRKLTEHGEQRLAVHEYCNIVLGKDSLAELRLEALLGITQNIHTLGPTLRTYFEVTELDRSRARTIKTPTLVIAGELSPKIYGAIIREVVNSLPNSELLTLAGASHGLQIDNAVDFNEAVLEFLSRNELAVRGEKRQ